MSSTSSPMKYVVVTGGVISGVGKGIIASSTGVLLRSLGLSVSAIKIDPYLNIDAGTMSPYDHGECFVLNDGGEVDLDLGNYERFLDVTLSSQNNITTGKIYQQVIEKERRGDYLGKTVQVVPHVTDAIQDWIERVSILPIDNKNCGNGSRPDVCVIELGGTVGDIESAPFVEALRQFQFRVGPENFFLIHVSLIPSVGTVQEQKTKPTQHSVQALRALGLSPDVLACRSLTELEPSVKDKLSMFCHVTTGKVLSVYDCESVYHVPMLLKRQGLCETLRDRLCIDKMSLPPSNIQVGTEYFDRWTELAFRLSKSPTSTDADGVRLSSLSIAIVGKYTNLHECYLSVIKALNHAEMNTSLAMSIVWIEASDLEPVEDTGETGETGEKTGEKTLKNKEAWESLKGCDGIIVPGGFGQRGTEGKILACKYARENQVPLLGICLGFQLSVAEHARSLCGLTDANSEEFNPNAAHKVIILMPEITKGKMGGSMRLGTRPTRFVHTPKSESESESESYKRVYTLYKEFNKISTNTNDSDTNGIGSGIGIGSGTDGNVDSNGMGEGLDEGLGLIHERHRHRYEVNPELISILEQHGLCFVGKDVAGERMEIMERSDHPYYVACQYHPEFQSRPLDPSPLFVGLLRAANNYRNKSK